MRSAISFIHEQASARVNILFIFIFQIFSKSKLQYHTFNNHTQQIVISIEFTCQTYTLHYNDMISGITKF